MDRGKKYYSEAARIKAAYVLNLCTVSVSQIIDYHDAYILEQEYDSILNNLNLKQVPKDDSLLNILREILNTITFFRIQQIRKEQIEKKYQRSIKNAIWSAVPSINILVCGDPKAIACALATAIGSGYMNYRKEKANAGASKDDELVELEITAIEQLNALRRELFTTAWRLADEYNFDDELRLTENQIKQYNNILMDNNIIRKYSRMEAIASKFKAYPPFWYNYGHVANEIANDYKIKLDKLKDGNEQSDVSKYEDIKNHYINKAKESFNKFFELNDISILREDFMTSSCALEFAEILLQEENYDKETIVKLIQQAEKNAFNAFDLLQICAINYYRIDEKKKAARILKRLIIEGYNKTANIKLLSAIYVKLYFEHNLTLDSNENVLTNYELLKCIVGNNNESFLLPMPQPNTSGESVDLTENYFKAYSFSYKKLLKRCFLAITKNYYHKCGSIAKDLWLDFRKNGIEYMTDTSSLLKGYIALVNKIIKSFMKIKFIRDNDIMHDIVPFGVEQLKRINKAIQDSKTRNFVTMPDFKSPLYNLINRIGLSLSEIITVKLFTLEELLNFEIDMEDFCISNSLPLPMDMNPYNEETDTSFNDDYISYNMVDDDRTNQINNERNDRIKDLLCKKLPNVIINKRYAELILDERNISLFRSNKALKGDKCLISNLLCIIKDNSSNNHHLVLLPNGLVFIKDNNISSKIPFSKICYIENPEQGIRYLDETKYCGLNSYIGIEQEYYNDGVRIPELIELTKELQEIEGRYKAMSYDDLGFYNLVRILNS